MSAQSGEGHGSRGRAEPVEVVDIHPGTVVVLVGASALAGAGWAIVTIAPDMVTTLAIGVVLGVALSPLAAGVQRRFNRSRIAAAAIVGITLAALFAAVLVLVAPAAVDQASEFSEELPATVRELYSWPIIGDRLERADAAGDVEDAIADLPAKIDDETLAAFGERLLGGAFSTLVVLIAAVGVMIDGEVIVRRLRAVVPPSRQQRADEMGRIVYHAFGSYFAGSLTVAVLNGLFVLSVGLLLGVPLAPIAAIWAALTNLIPQIGGFLGGGFFVLLALTDSPTKAVIAGVLFLAYQQFENNVVQPAIVGSAVNLTPPATMLAALIGGAAAGVPGALVATPLLGAGKALYLESRGRLPTRRDAALRRRLQARVDRVKQAATDLTDSIREGP